MDADFTYKSIEATDISKHYRLYSRPLDRLLEVVVRRPRHNVFTSLENISFCVEKGECMGIIGENGAGKSTLLKILAGTLAPSSGRIRVQGRVAALLELGAGFHQEFTGRQNIYLNAALLGLTEDEIASREDEILSFAEIGQFIDRPIKTYSSGMVVRLAFSIATSVDPDVLVIDEALSVGDQYFQKKCIDRILGFREKGKTILFCSHSMYIVNLLCNRALWIDQGRIREQGRCAKVTAEYENYLRKKENHEDETSDGQNHEAVLVKRVRQISLNDSFVSVKIKHKSSLKVGIEVESLDEAPYSLALGLRRNDDIVCHAVNLSKADGHCFSGKGLLSVRFNYRDIPLLHGEYNIVVFVLDEHGVYCYHKMNSAQIIIEPPAEYQSKMGLLDMEYDWKIVSV